MKTKILALIAALLAASAYADSSAKALPAQTATVTVTADGTQPFTYQWTKDGVNIPGATAATFTIQAVKASDAGIYAAKITNEAGTTVSDLASLIVIITPSGAKAVWSIVQETKSLTKP